MGQRWESHCNRCGLCCYEKVRQDNGFWELDPSSPCPWLECETARCKIYERRLKVYPRCRRITLYHALFAPYLPSVCAYVRKFRPSWLPSTQLKIQGPEKKHGLQLLNRNPQQHIR